jgi:hypothetical protein
MPSISSPVIRELPPALPARNNGDDKGTKKPKDADEGLSGAPAPSPA